jgi:hypothetical protein
MMILAMHDIKFLNSFRSSKINHNILERGMIQ